MKIIPFGLVVAVLLWSLAEASPVHAKDSGYEGLVAPAPESGNAPRDQEEPPGYSGLIPGRSGTSSAQQKQPPQMTRTPGDAPQVAPRSSDDLKALAQVYGQDRDGDLLPDALKKPEPLSEKTTALLAGPRARIKGKLPMVYMIGEKIRKLLPQVEDERLSPEARAEMARKAYGELAPFADGLRAKKMVPDDIYRQMGLSETFIEEEKTGTTVALDELNEALQKLKEYE
ncbi:MAG: hypothetical protein V1721_02400 [Pseudomonadota bacterium]